ncbi:hypothetical protein JOF29_007301 [Kribbella aluminosa]|uniref:Ricin B lectin domain-containing protein n=2 Tax=Kribbella aluminosa TaxID=416017 RepID=A0ABS4UX33_9ACTN|nr:hypothetical protein [Kribbella aluminosa]
MTQSFGVTHPSEGNYLALFSGSTQGISGDPCPLSYSAPNLGSELIGAGLTFSEYSESMPSTGYTACASPDNQYQRARNPAVDFTNVPAADNKPFSSFPTDFSTLPTVSFVTANMCNSMHNCSVATGDAWTKNKLDAYARWATTHNSLLIVTFDEDDFTTVNQIATVFSGAHVRPGSYGEHINHYNVLRTIEDSYDLPHAGSAATATPITDIWGNTLASGGIYQLSRTGNTQLIDDPNSSTTAGIQLIVWHNNSGTNQKWTATANPDGSYSFKNSASGQCLDDAGSSTAPGGRIIQWPCTGNDNQHWGMTANGSGTSLVSKISGLAIQAGGTADGSLLTQESGTGTAWTFTKVG